MSSEEMLDWKSGLNEAGGRSEYAAELRAFMGLARDSVDHVFAALNRGCGGDAQSIVHEVREKAGRLGCRFLAARSCTAATLQPCRIRSAPLPPIFPDSERPRGPCSRLPERPSGGTVLCREKAAYPKAGRGLFFSA